MFWGYRRVLIAAAILVAAPAVADCRIDAANLDLAAKTRFQQDFFTAIVIARPELTELARLNRDLQIAMATSRQMKLAHLARTAPDRLVTDQGVSAFSNVNWTRGDDSALRAADPAYDRLIARIETLTAVNQQHPDWPVLRNWARNDPEGRAKVTSLAATLKDSRANVAEALSRCQ